MRYHALFLWLAVAALCGCNKSPSEEYQEIIRQQYGQLTAARKSPLVELRDEIARIEEQGHTPARLARPAPRPEHNAATELMNIFSVKRLAGLDSATAELLPGVGLPLGPVEVQPMISFRRRRLEMWTAWRQAMQRPECDFLIDHQSGYFADTQFVTAMSIGIRLESFWTAECISTGDLDEACQSVGLLLKACQYLSQERHVSSRLMAAHCRQLPLSAIEGITRHRNVSATHLSRLADALSTHLHHWTPDAEAWIGDRALGLHMYEAIRGGELLYMFTDDELKSFADNDLLGPLMSAPKRNIDQDELFYLQAMNRLIAACAEPLYARRPVFSELEIQLDQLRNTPDYPVVAATLLLPQIEPAQGQQAWDRAAVEIWTLAVCQAVGRPTPQLDKNPVSGEPYRWEANEYQVIVQPEITEGKLWPRTIVVPILAGDSPRVSEGLRTAQPTVEKRIYGEPTPAQR